MRKTEQVASWAVYQITLLGQPGPNVVCGQGEWEAIERAQPGLHRLVRGGIPNEGEAERLARGASGDDKRAVRKKAALLLAPAPEPTGAPDEGPGDESGEGEGPVILPSSAPPEGGEPSAPGGRADRV